MSGQPGRGAGDSDTPGSHRDGYDGEYGLRASLPSKSIFVAPAAGAMDATHDVQQHSGVRDGAGGADEGRDWDESAGELSDEGEGRRRTHSDGEVGAGDDWGDGGSDADGSVEPYSQHSAPAAGERRVPIDEHDRPITSAVVGGRPATFEELLERELAMEQRGASGPSTGGAATSAATAAAQRDQKPPLSARPPTSHGPTSRREQREPKVLRDSVSHSDRGDDEGGSATVAADRQTDFPNLRQTVREFGSPQRGHDASQQDDSETKTDWFDRAAAPLEASGRGDADQGAAPQPTESRSPPRSSLRSRPDGSRRGEPLGSSSVSIGNSAAALVSGDDFAAQEAEAMREFSELQKRLGVRDSGARDAKTSKTADHHDTGDSARRAPRDTSYEEYEHDPSDDDWGPLPGTSSYGHSLHRTTRDVAAADSAADDSRAERRERGDGGSDAPPSNLVARVFRTEQRDVASARSRRESAQARTSDDAAHTHSQPTSGGRDILEDDDDFGHGTRGYSGAREPARADHAIRERALEAMVQEKMTELNAEIAKYKAETNRAKRLREQHEAEVESLKRQTADFDRWRDAERAKQEAWKQEQTARMRRERAELQRKLRAAQNAGPDRKERAEIEKLRSELAAVRADADERAKRDRAALERSRRSVKQLQARITDLEEQVSVYEQERLDRMEEEQRRKQHAAERARSEARQRDIAARRAEEAEAVRRSRPRTQEREVWGAASSRDYGRAAPTTDRFGVVRASYGEEHDFVGDAAGGPEERDDGRAPPVHSSTQASRQYDPSAYGDSDTRPVTTHDDVRASADAALAGRAGARGLRAHGDGRVGGVHASVPDLHGALSAGTDGAYDSPSRRKPAWHASGAQDAPDAHPDRSHDDGTRLAESGRVAGGDGPGHGSEASGTGVPGHASNDPVIEEGDVLVSEKQIGSGKFERRYRSGRRVVQFSNGTTKDIMPDGRTTVKFNNGDVKQTYPDTGLVVYYYADARTTHTTYKDGTEVFEFPNGQVERHMPGKSKNIEFPDGTVKVVGPDGVQRSTFPDGTELVEYPDGRREVFNAQGELVEGEGS